MIVSIYMTKGMFKTSVGAPGHARDVEEIICWLHERVSVGHSGAYFIKETAAFSWRSSSSVRGAPVGKMWKRRIHDNGGDTWRP